jgi:hypothetical protein
MSEPLQRDSTRVTDQPALTTSDGRVWLLVGAALALVSAAVLFPLSGFQPSPALVGGIAVVAIFIVMGIVRAAVTPVRTRLLVLAVLLGAMAVVAFGATLITAFTA